MMEQLELMPKVYMAGRYEFATEFQTNWRKCYTSSIVLVSEGGGVLGVDDQWYQMKEGMLVYLPAGKVHRWDTLEAAHPMVHIYCYFDWVWRDRRTFDGPHNKFVGEAETMQEAFVDPGIPLRLKTVNQVAHVKAWLNRFEAFFPASSVLAQQRLIFGLREQGEFLQFLYQFAEFSLDEATIPDPRIQAAMRWLDTQVAAGEPVTLDQWIMRSGMGRSRFFSCFRQDTGFTPTAYYNHVRIAQAKVWLGQEGWKITEMADRLNFATIHHFSQMFKRFTGMSPTRFSRFHGLSDTHGHDPKARG